MPQTVDGHPIVVGMDIWVRSNGGIGNFTVTKHTVKKVYEKKVEYTQPDKDGYIGARIKDVVFFDENKARNA